MSMQFFLAGDAEPMVVTLGVDNGSEEDPTALADSVFGDLIGAGTIFVDSSYYSLYTIGPFVASIMTSTGPQIGTGTLSQDGDNPLVLPPPNNCAVLVQRRTARGGRKGRGRMYFPPIFPTEASITASGLIDSTPWAAWVTAMNEFHAALVASSTPMYLLHSEAAGPIAPDPVTSLVVEQRIATQRTRLRP